MATEKAIQFDRLPKTAKNELFDFYEFLLQKYSPVRKKSRHNLDRKDIFFQKVASQTFSLQNDYTFDRDELHER